MTSANLNTGNINVDLDVQFNKFGENHQCVVSPVEGDALCARFLRTKRQNGFPREHACENGLSHNRTVPSHLVVS